MDNGIKEIIAENNKKGVPMVILDTKGDCHAEFARSNDVFFYPTHSKSIGWSIFNDIETLMDIELIAKSFFSEQPGISPFWVDGRRSIFAGILKYCYAAGKTTNEEVWKTACLSSDDLAQLFEGVPGCERARQFITTEGIDKQALWSDYPTPLMCFSYLSDKDGDFSIKKWLSNPQGNLYLIGGEGQGGYEADVHAKTLLTVFLDLLMRKTFSLPLNHSKLVFILDGIQSLGRLSTLISFMTCGMERGVLVCGIGRSSNEMLESVYGKDEAKTILASIRLEMARY